MKFPRRTLASLTAAALTGVLGLVVPTVVAPPAGAWLTCPFTAGFVADQAIPDRGSAVSTIDLSAYAAEGDRIVDLNVWVRIDHTFDSDLAISLSSAGHTVDLSSGNGSSGDNYGAGDTPTVFDDAAATSIVAGTAPFTGSFRPEESLNPFDDLNPGALWTLRIEDTVSGDTGTLVWWSLRFRTEFCDDTDKDYVKNDYDDCPTVKGVAPTGCPARNRSVTLNYNTTVQEFRGRLSCAAETRCAYNQPVRIYRAVSGADQLVARLRTDAAGNYRLARTNPLGSYYTVAPRVYEENVAVCLRAQSATLVR